jgi:hypothetical protein
MSNLPITLVEITNATNKFDKRYAENWDTYYSLLPWYQELPGKFTWYCFDRLLCKFHVWRRKSRVF